MIVSRPVFCQRFADAFGDMPTDNNFLVCFRTVMPDGGYFYAAPFVIRKPLDLYYHLNNVDGVVLDKLVEQSADVVVMAFWSEERGLEIMLRSDPIAVPFKDLYLIEEDIE